MREVHRDAEERSEQQTLQILDRGISYSCSSQGNFTYKTLGPGIKIVANGCSPSSTRHQEEEVCPCSLNTGIPKLIQFRKATYSIPPIRRMLLIRCNRCLIPRSGQKALQQQHNEFTFLRLYCHPNHPIHAPFRSLQ